MSCVRSRLSYVPVGMSCVRITPVIRSCWNVLRSDHACHTFLLECLAFGLRLSYVPVGMSCVRITPVSFPLSGKERRLAVSCVSIPRGSGSPLELSRRLCGYRTCLVHFWIVRFFVAIPTEYEGTRRTESAARQSTLLRESLGLVMLSAGSTLGLRAPDCAKESSTLWTLFLGFAA